MTAELMLQCTWDDPWTLEISSPFNPMGEGATSAPKALRHWEIPGLQDFTSRTVKNEAKF